MAVVTNGTQSEQVKQVLASECPHVQLEFSDVFLVLTLSPFLQRAQAL